MLEVLKDLHWEDHFGIVQFDDRILSWKESLTKATKENVIEAMAYVQNINSYGGK